MPIIYNRVAQNLTQSNTDTEVKPSDCAIYKIHKQTAYIVADHNYTVQLQLTVKTHTSADHRHTATREHDVQARQLKYK